MDVTPLSRVVEYFAPADRYNDADDHYHASIAVVFLLIVAAMLMLMTALQVITKPWDSRSVILMGALNVPQLASIILLLAAIRRWQCYALGTHAVLAAGYICNVAAVVYTGGPLHSPAVNIFLLFPVIAFLITQHRGGLYWTAICLTTMAVLLLAARAGCRFEAMTPDMSEGEQRIWIWLYVFLITAGFAVFYERTYQRLRTQRNEERQNYHYLAHHDNLTGLPNRLTFNADLEAAIARSHVRRHSVLLFFIDLNNFKPINDSHGHHTGDEVLRHIARRIRAAVRGTDTVCRLGGDEFAVIVENVDHGDAHTLLAVIQARIAETLTVDEIAFNLSASIGVSHYPGGAGSARELVLKADQAMYEAKTSGSGIRWAAGETVTAVNETDDRQLPLLAEIRRGSSRHRTSH